MKYKVGCTSILFGENPTILLNELKRRIGNRKTIITYAEDYTFPKTTTRFGVIQIMRWGKREYRGVLNIVQIY